MKQRFFSIFASLLLIATASCTRYLDMTPTDKVSDKVLWRTTEIYTLHIVGSVRCV